MRKRFIDKQRASLGCISIVEDHDPTDHHRGQRHQNSDVRQPPAAPSPVPSMPMVVVNGSDFVRWVLIRLPNIVSTDTRIEACHGDLPP